MTLFNQVRIDVNNFDFVQLECSRRKFMDQNHIHFFYPAHINMEIIEKADTWTIIMPRSQTAEFSNYNYDRNLAIWTETPRRAPRMLFQLPNTSQPAIDLLIEFLIEELHEIWPKASLIPESSSDGYIIYKISHEEELDEDVLNQLNEIDGVTFDVGLRPCTTCGSFDHLVADCSTVCPGCRGDCTHYGLCLYCCKYHYMYDLGCDALKNALPRKLTSYQLPKSSYLAVWNVNLNKDKSQIIG